MTAVANNMLNSIAGYGLRAHVSLASLAMGTSRALGKSGLHLACGFALFMGVKIVTDASAGAADRVKKAVNGCFGENFLSNSVANLAMFTTLVGVATLIPWGVTSLAAYQFTPLSCLAMGPQAYLLTAIISGFVLSCVTS